MGDVQDQTQRLLDARRSPPTPASPPASENPPARSRAVMGAEMLARARTERERPAQPAPTPAATRPPPDPEPTELWERSGELAALLEANPGPWQVDERGRLSARSTEDVEDIAQHFGLTLDELRTINGRTTTYKDGSRWPYRSTVSAWIHVVPDPDPELGGRADYSIHGSRQETMASSRRKRLERRRLEQAVRNE